MPFRISGLHKEFAVLENPINYGNININANALHLKVSIEEVIRSFKL